jgi:2-phospho-L-lactate guanylyltransferase
VTGPWSWSIVVPLKSLDVAKSRMSRLPVRSRQALVVAMASDVRDAVLGCPEVRDVVIVTRDARWQRLLGADGLRFVADLPADSLNDALRRGAAACRAARPAGGVAALMADLPALTAAELSVALDLARAASTSFVPDAGGDGTTLFAARSGAPFRPHYGPGSHAGHRAAGAVEIHRPDLHGIRQDVDTVEDLERARALGVGRHTGRLMTADLTSRAPSSRSQA